MDLDLLMRLNPEDLDAIRFIVKAGNESIAEEFLNKIQNSKLKIVGRVPFMIDVCNWRRASIVGLEPRDISFGDKLTLL